MIYCGEIFTSDFISNVLLMSLLTAKVTCCFVRSPRER
jgi:hypothetical protein